MDCSTGKILETIYHKIEPCDRFQALIIQSQPLMSSIDKIKIFFKFIGQIITLSDCYQSVEWPLQRLTCCKIHTLTSNDETVWFN